MRQCNRNNEARVYLPGSKLLEDDDLPAGMVLRPLVQSFDHEISSGQPRLAIVIQPAQELLARQFRGLGEAFLHKQII